MDEVAREMDITRGSMMAALRRELNRDVLIKPTRIIRHGAKHVDFKISEAFYGVLFSASLSNSILTALYWEH